MLRKNTVWNNVSNYKYHQLIFTRITEKPFIQFSNQFGFWNNLFNCKHCAKNINYCEIRTANWETQIHVNIMPLFIFYWQNSLFHISAFHKKLYLPQLENGAIFSSLELTCKCLTALHVESLKKNVFQNYHLIQFVKKLFSLRDFLPLTLPNVQSMWTEILKFTVNILFRGCLYTFHCSGHTYCTVSVVFFPPCYNSAVTGSFSCFTTDINSSLLRKAWVCGA